jgi:hypothetical protein
VCLCVCPSDAVCLPVRLSIGLSIRMSVCLSAHPCVCLPACMSQRTVEGLSPKLSIRVSVCLSVCLSMCLSARLHVAEDSLCSRGIRHYPCCELPPVGVHARLKGHMEREWLRRAKSGFRV